MAWPFGSSNKVAPAPLRTLSKDRNLCLMFSEWKCKQRRYNGDGKRSCYCGLHTCEAPACINVVAGPKQRYCKKHQINAQQPQRGSRPLAMPKDDDRLDGHQRQLMKKGAGAQIFIRHKGKVDDEAKAVAKAIGTVATGQSFGSMMKSETSTWTQIMNSMFDNKMFNDLQWKGMAEYLNAKMNNYIVQEKNFAAFFCQDLLLYASNKVEQSHVEFVVYVAELLAFPLLAPYIAVATGAAAAGGAIASQAAGKGFDVAKKVAVKGAGAGAKKAMGLEDRTELAGRPDMSMPSQGWVNDVLNYFSKAKTNPITFARVLGRHIESHRSGDEENLIIKHFGPSILSWDDRLAPGSFL